jgi:hypothetical protein
LQGLQVLAQLVEHRLNLWENKQICF